MIASNETHMKYNGIKLHVYTNAYVNMFVYMYVHLYVK